MEYIVQAMSETPNYIDDPMDCSGYEEEEVVDYDSISCYE